MSVQHFVDEQGRYDVKTLQELWPSVVDEVVRAVDPAEVILARVRSAINTFAPVDVIVTDSAEMAECHDDVGSILYWPSREGRAVYRRASVQAG